MDVGVRDTKEGGFLMRGKVAIEKERGKVSDVLGSLRPLGSPEILWSLVE